MAFGFNREKGSARGYVNVDNPAFAPGQRLSRRQYDAFVAALGERRSLPPAAQAQATVADIEGRLAGLRAAMDRARTTRTRQRRAAEVAAVEAQAEAAREAVYRRERQGAGQRRYNLMLDLYVTEQRNRGRVLTKREAAREGAFREAVDLAKGRKTRIDKRTGQRNPNDVARNIEDRRRGFALVGGADKFREEYERKYGRPARPRRPGRGRRKRT